MYFGKKLADITLQVVLEDAIENVLNRSKTIYGNVAAVPKGIETTIVTFTVPVGSSFVILGSSATCMTDCTFRLYINDELFEVRRNSWCDRNVEFQTKQRAIAEYVIKITGEHNSHLYNGPGNPHDMDASITGIGTVITVS